MKILWSIIAVLGLAVVALGGLWLAQGVGLIDLEPIACVGECEPIESPSLTWSFIGAATIAAGVGIIWLARIQRRRRP